MFETVPVKIKNGHITNPEILKVGDAILFVGTDPSRPKQIGHVEFIYTITSTANKPTSNKNQVIILSAQVSVLLFRLHWIVSK